MDEYQADRPLSTMSNIISSLSGENIPHPSQDVFKCLLCTFATSNRSELIKHLISHCTSEQYNNSDYKTILEYLSVLESYQKPNGDSCSSFTLTESEIKESDASSLDASRIIRNINKRKINMQEIKKCKHCHFIANTKIEYWEHMRCHINNGFTCSKCTFITKYKHHMTHHWLSMHDGSKPFKCKKCSYMCVSKSMLTSHLKKHSNVYSYRCASCPYKSKFCNALKRHLRKNDHQPAMVLNADGSPNPLSIIDVYGTKRGPKQKQLIKEELDTSVVTTTTNNQLDSTMTSLPSSPLDNSYIHYSNMTAINGINDGHWTSQNYTNKNQPNTMFPYSDLVAAFNLSSNVSLHEDKIFHEKYTENMQKANINVQLTDTLTEYTKTLSTEDLSSKTILQNLSLTHLDMSSDVNKRTESTDVPLDLRITEQITNNNKLQFQSLIKNTMNSSKDIRTNKRKGKAIKLEHYIMEEDTDEPKQNKDEFLPNSIIDFYEINERAIDVKNKDDLFNTKLICHYCEIVFSNLVMYTMHMSCHDLTHPYTCNMCGQQCNDKLSFTLHIVQTEH